MHNNWQTISYLANSFQKMDQWQPWYARQLRQAAAVLAGASECESEGLWKVWEKKSFHIFIFPKYKVWLINFPKKKKILKTLRTVHQ
jgi:hypothetical protein